jgi:hypothetical protein
LLFPLLIVALLSASNGCAPVYIPPAAHTDLFTGEGEFHAAVYTGSNGYDGQAAYALTDHLSLAGAFSYDDQSANDTTFQRHSYGEFAIGWFTYNDGLHLEALAGIGRGHAEAGDVDLHLDLFAPIEDTTYLLTERGDYTRYYLQGNLGTSGRIFEEGWNLRGELGIASRLALVDFSRFTRNDTTSYHTNSLFTEFILFARAGGDLLSFELQLGLSSSLRSELPFDYDPWMGSVGMRLTLGR